MFVVIWYSAWLCERLTCPSCVSVIDSPKSFVQVPERLEKSPYAICSKSSLSSFELDWLWLGNVYVVSTTSATPTVDSISVTEDDETTDSW